MIRVTALLWIALLVVAGGIVMHVSYQVRHVQKHLEQLARDTAQEREAIRILGAEWDTLNDPRRIDDLAQRHLALQPTPIQRVVTLDQIPLRPSEDQLAKMGAASSDKSARDGAAARKSVTPDRPARPAAPIEIASRRVAPAPAVRAAGASDPVAPAALDGVGLILARVEQRK
jgi:cell division protein FtsL